ncbi:heme-binding protein [[Mycobacterium] vasticus]|uniref:Heme-binding protein n=1 Tax=[Mycobacterium] vasticus TaxID=2875777 RepID=A0ABU5YTX1_9MYCO|nr:heme-binding protein [Mycolicibacter sp. MYC017]MEB3068573.1 heme-binding protein [Mycolicibacter sp. MYC017]
MPHNPIPRTSLRVAGVTAAAFATALLSPTAANADPAPGCTAADMANVAAGVAAQTSGYLFAHPDLNAFYTDLHNKPDDQVPAAVDAYFDANPQAHTDLLGIRQPLTDFRSRCGLTQPDRPLLGD